MEIAALKAAIKAMAIAQAQSDQSESPRASCKRELESDEETEMNIIKKERIER